jgi:hypothetical protein
MGRVLSQASREIVAHQRHAGEERLSRHFQDTAEDLSSRLNAFRSFFGVVMQCILARSTIELRHTSQGLHILARANQMLHDLPVEWLNTPDFTDCCDTMLLAIQALPLDQRAAPLQGLLQTLQQRLPQLPDQASTANMLLLLKTLDQLCETASSKDQLALTQFRQYQDLEELLIRDRVLHDDFCSN